MTDRTEKRELHPRAAKSEKIDKVSPEKRELRPRAAKSEKIEKISTEESIRPNRRFIINEIDIDERENVEIEEEKLKPTELNDESDISGDDSYKSSNSQKTGVISIKEYSNGIPFVSIQKIPICSKKESPRKQNPENRPINKGCSSDEEESVSECSEYAPDGLEDDYDDDEDFSDEIPTEEISTEEILSALDEEDFPRRINNKEKFHDDGQIDDAMEFGSDEENDTQEMSDNSETEDEETEQKGKLNSRRNKKISPDENDYSDIHLNTEEYFEGQSEKILTSNRTLGKLKTSKLDKQTIDELLEKKLHISKEHSDGILRLNHKNVSLFPFWHFMLEEGFSILLHGLGSKRKLICDFHKKMIKGFPTLFVNGFFPSITLKEILDGIIKDLMGLEAPSSVNDCMDLIEQTLKKHPDDRIYLLIHNLDGPMLRSKRIQDKISYLASFPNLHLIASVDHINASLLWDNAKRSRFNFYWSNVTTFLPYKEETLYENSLMVRQSGALALSSLHNVFLSLPDKSRAVYIILVNYQIENSGANYQGMAFKDLYQKAREGFFVTNDVTLRSQLTEFRDHKLIKEKRGVDGIEYLSIPLDNALLKEFLERQEES